MLFVMSNAVHLVQKARTEVQTYASWCQHMRYLMRTTMVAVPNTISDTRCDIIVTFRSLLGGNERKGFFFLRKKKNNHVIVESKILDNL
ncbi:hypothetical protein PNOK_0195500 [Pyrrhoderma noxium]|uniref:Uncharacterized protein n=1 Tax=Pyrrhoderma noxium TaxID=2282107 RepID=A0A286UQW9_9AGAM|nr:hypothetical protein PNOK_0195500 [Pyrrhoderma noxium]